MAMREQESWWLPEPGPSAAELTVAQLIDEAVADSLAADAPVVSGYDEPELNARRTCLEPGRRVALEDGGLGLDTVSQLHAIEQVAYADASLASIYTAHYLGLEVFRLRAAGAQREQWTAPLARGQFLAGFALTEPDAGSDTASMRTTARRDGDGFVLNGSKTYISNAAEADVLAMFATTDPAKKFRGISAFAIAKDIATETRFRVVDAALQVHGRAGYMAESEIERLYRDCRVLRIYEGTSQIQLLTIARQLTTTHTTGRHTTGRHTTGRGGSR